MTPKLYVGICGHAGSGKDTLAKLIASHMTLLSHNVKLRALADPMKEICQRVFQFTDDQLWGPSERRAEAHPVLKRLDGSPLTARVALQLLGTEWGRCCCEDTWVRLLVEETREARSYDVVLVTDVRFRNEADYLHEREGRIVTITRPGSDGTTVGGVAGHASEREQDTVAGDYGVVNDGTLRDLDQRAYEVARALHEDSVAIRLKQLP